MGLNLSQFYTLPFEGQGTLTDIDFNKPSKQTPLAVRISVDWSIQDARYGAIRPLTTDPYALTIDVARALVRSIDDIKAAIIDNSGNSYPVLLECQDSGFQVRVEPGEVRHAPLITTGSVFKLWSLYGSGGLALSNARATDVYFVNVSLQPFTASAPRQSVPFSPVLPASINIPIGQTNKTAISPIFSLAGFLRSLRVSADFPSRVSAGSMRFTLTLETSFGVVLNTIFTGPFRLPTADTYNVVIFDDDNINLAVPAGARIYLAMENLSGDAFTVIPRVNGVIAN